MARRRHRSADESWLLRRWLQDLEHDRLAAISRKRDLRLELDSEPRPHVARLMAALGVPIVVGGGSPVTSVQLATSTVDCRVPGCANAAKHDRGIYAYLCEEHVKEKQRTGLTPGGDRSADASASPRPSPGPRAQTSASDGFEAKIKELGKLGKDVDKARARAKALTERALSAKASAEALEQAFRARTRELMEGS